jgi:hypothetical protein
MLYEAVHSIHGDSSTSKSIYCVFLALTRCPNPVAGCLPTAVLRPVAASVPACCACRHHAPHTGSEPGR